MSKRFSVFVQEYTSAGWESVSASDHQAAVEAVSSRVESGEFVSGKVVGSDGKETHIAPKPK